MIFSQIESLATSITSHALDANETFPRVTLPHFDLKTQQLSSVAGADLIFYAPILEEKDREDWEQYAFENQDWMVQDMVRMQGPGEGAS